MKNFKRRYILKQVFWGMIPLRYILRSYRCRHWPVVVQHTIENICLFSAIRIIFFLNFYNCSFSALKNHLQRQIFTFGNDTFTCQHFLHIFCFVYFEACTNQHCFHKFLVFWILRIYDYFITSAKFNMSSSVVTPFKFLSHSLTESRILLFITYIRKHFKDLSEYTR